MFDTLRSLIHKNHNFIITSHVNPDGDAIGSEIALYDYLKKLNKNPNIINYSSTPKNYKFIDRNQVIQKFTEEKHKDLILNSDVIVIVDTNEYSRLKNMKEVIKSSTAVKICIDHHLSYSNNGFDYTLYDTNSPATGEILFKFFESEGNDIINKEMAIALYTAIMTDTGSFRFPRTDSETHIIASKLIELGANPDIIFDEVYNKSSFGKLKLLSLFLNKLKLIEEGRIIYSSLLLEDFEQTGTEVTDSDGFSSHMLSLDTVQIGIIFTQTKKGVKISFRSKGEIYINELAMEFGGGGHKNAAGTFVEDTNTKKVIEEVLIKTKNHIK